MCGCPIKPGGLWDADELEVTALVKRNGEKLPPIDLAFAGETSQFAGTVPVEGDYSAAAYPAAAAVLHHHQRWDGEGFPATQHKDGATYQLTTTPG